MTSCFPYWFQLPEERRPQLRGGIIATRHYSPVESLLQDKSPAMPRSFLCSVWSSHLGGPLFALGEGQFRWLKKHSAAKWFKHTCFVVVVLSSKSRLNHIKFSSSSPATAFDTWKDIECAQLQSLLFKCGIQLFSDRASTKVYACFDKKKSIMVILKTGNLGRRYVKCHR